MRVREGVDIDALAHSHAVPSRPEGTERPALGKAREEEHGNGAGYERLREPHDALEPGVREDAHVEEADGDLDHAEREVVEHLADE